MKNETCACGARARETTTGLELFGGGVVLKGMRVLYCPGCKEEILTSEQAAEAGRIYRECF
jgi:hypothetical protein